MRLEYFQGDLNGSAISGIMRTVLASVVMLQIPGMLMYQESRAQVTISGMVTELETGAPIAGATVVIQGTTVGSTTNSEGVYSIELRSPDDILVFSFVGFVTKRLRPAAGAAVLNVRLKLDILRLEELVVVGSRRLPRLVKDSAVPVDVLSPRDIASLPTTDMDDMLRTLIPSYGVQRGGDEAMLVRPATLRSLPSDNVMVLINGKRRHRSASVALSASSLNQGAQGPDLNMVPGIAIKQIELLRDGAAAQYGADAVAGVINFQLRDASDGVLLRLHGGQNFHGDGGYGDVGANFGLPLPRNGFVNVSLEYRNTAPTVRSSQREDAQMLGSRGYPVADPAQIWGNPDVDHSWVGFLNAGLDFGTSTGAYAFGGWGQRTSEGGFFFRSPGTTTARGSVFRFSSDEEAVRAVVDLDPNDGIRCQALPDLPGLDSNHAVVEQFLRDYGGSCYLFNELFPGGFTPRFGAHVGDLSLTAGVRGALHSGFAWDVSFSAARSVMDYYIYNTINASYGPDTPTSFRPRDYIQEDVAANVDFSFPMALTFLASPLNIAWGAEWRSETFESTPGDFFSYNAGPFAGQGFSVGSNGYQGLNPKFAGRWSRPNYALYVDLEADASDALVLNVATRYENFYDSFGSTLTGKVAVLWRATNWGSLRGTASTGFRAPTPGQANLNVFRTTSFSVEKGLIEVGQLPPTHPIAQGLGGRELTEERSTNLSFGAVIELAPDLDLTIDYFDISFRDRIAVTGSISLTDEITRIIDSRNILGGVGNLGEIKFYSNDFDTRTRGTDLLLAWQRTRENGHEMSASAAWNWTSSKLVSFASPKEIDEFLGARLENPVTLSLLTPQRQVEIEELNPRHRIALTGRYQWKSLHGVLRLNYYDSWSACRFRTQSCAGASGESVLDTYKGAWIADAEIGFALLSAYRLAIGVHNLLDIAPNAHPEETARQGNLHPRSTPWDYNGAAWYMRLSADLF